MKITKAEDHFRALIKIIAPHDSKMTLEYIKKETPEEYKKMMDVIEGVQKNALNFAAVLCDGQAPVHTILGELDKLTKPEKQ